MKTVYALLLSLLGLVVIIFNRFAAEESLRIRPTFLSSVPVWMARTIAILGGSFFVLFGLLMALGYLQ